MNRFDVRSHPTTMRKRVGLGIFDAFARSPRSAAVCLQSGMNDRSEKRKYKNDETH